MSEQQNIALRSLQTQDEFLRQTPASSADHAELPELQHPQHSTNEKSQTIFQKLNHVDRYWEHKGAFQTVAILTGLIGIGLVAWVVTTDPRDGFFFNYVSSWSVWPSLVTFAVSIIWCSVYLIVLVTRKRPVHPGVRVALDLLLWLGFLFTIMLAVLSYLSLSRWGESGSIYASWASTSGNYHFTANGTWVWQDYEWQTPDTATDTREDCNNSWPYEIFADCPMQDARVNQLWREKPARVHAELAAIVCQCISFLAHLVLFIWACVDCHRYNKSKVSRDAEVLAGNIVESMVQNGAVLYPSTKDSTKRVSKGQSGYVRYS